MAPELPPELWRMIILALDDRFYTWIIIRRVCSAFRSIAEDIFAAKCVVTYMMHASDEIMLNWDHNTCVGDMRWTLGFRFLPSHLDPSSAKERIVLKLVDGPLKLPIKDFQDYKVQKQTTKAEVFFASNTNFIRKLGVNWYFLRNESLCYMMRMPRSTHLTLHSETHSISVNWRPLAHALYYRQLKDERKERPHIRDFATGKPASHPLQFYPRSLAAAIPNSIILEGDEDLLEECREKSWIFWNARKTLKTVVLVRPVIRRTSGRRFGT